MTTDPDAEACLSVRKKECPMKDDEDDFIEDMIAYHIIMDSEKGGGRQPKSSGGCLSWIIFIIAVVLLISFIGSCSGNSKKSSYSSTRSTSATRICLASGCTNARMSGGYYCYSHTCIHSGCYEKRTVGSNYCSKHQPGTNNSNQKKTTTKQTNKSTEKKTTKTDPYDAGAYSDYEDFYEDWYDDFDGIDDAEMYWDEWQ